MQRADLWYIIDVDIITWESHTKNQTVLCHGSRYYHLKIMYEESNYYIMSWISILTQSFETRKTQNSNYEILWKSMLSHENHIGRIVQRYVMDVNFVTCESYTTKNQTMKRHGCWCYHMRNIYEESNCNTSFPCGYYCTCDAIWLMYSLF